jgi:hydrogenase maturation protein HypF
VNRAAATVEITVRGTVQGVGFRPFVYRLATRLGLTGSVCNSAAGVVITACGDAADIDQLVAALHSNPPPLAIITSVDIRDIPVSNTGTGFVVEPSLAGSVPAVDVVVDTATCDACLVEMRTPSNRRHRHAFINCTDCGPRFSIITGLPYDRANTTMAEFVMCPACRAEYESPADRRFHAQPVCCPHCGPTLRLLDKKGCGIPDADPLRRAVALLETGAIVAIKGLSGFHLACRADLPAAVDALRERKHRVGKPFAIMVRDIEAACRYAVISAREAALLCSAERPIVLCAKSAGASRLAAAIAPAVTTLGIMLPCTPLHHLLFDGATFDALVMTSANRSTEPICIHTADAVEKLGGIADAFLTHNRAIHVRLDDSIARVLLDRPLVVRRSRGFTPAPLPADADVQGVVALGGILKNTVTVGRGRACYVSNYLGSADTLATIDNCEHALDHLLAILGVTPALYATDLHPGGLLTALIADPTLPLIRVQHHHAHAVACMAENRLTGRAINIIYDGVGLGDDNTIWGGEVLVCDRLGYERSGAWRVGPMPGGDAATLNPGRMLMGVLWNTLGDDVMELCPWMPHTERRATRDLLVANVNCPVTSSMGRLFDACAALLDVCRSQTYEGQPAIELEGAAGQSDTGTFDVPIITDAGRNVADGAALLEAVRSAVHDRVPKPDVAARFHHAVVDATVRLAGMAADANGIDAVCLSGGCFLNKLLFEQTFGGLEAAGLRPFAPRVLPPGDEAISYGQALIAAAQHSQRQR